ncbi:MAG TPA: sensor histidine kinase [Candidatus Limnocylindrales bacterium]|jgi:two-component system sensor histidine kinase DegS
MDAARAAGEWAGGPFESLRAEAKAAVSYSANTLRAVRDGYRAAYTDLLSRWHALRDELDSLEGRAPRRPEIPDEADAAAVAAEAGAADAHLRALRREVERLGTELGGHQTDLSRFDLALRNVESTWLFLERGDVSLIGDTAQPSSPANLQMRMIEAQEAERSRLAQEIHDGPAQALSNAIFQVEYVERVLDHDERLARVELRLLRELLRRELAGVRSFITQLRPLLLDELGLNGALNETIEHMSGLIGIKIAAELEGPPERIGEAAQVVVLRFVQEALQNVRKHAHATSATVATRQDDGTWVLEVRDDGRGFDVGAVAARGRRNFGLQFMRERAELIDARFEVRSRPDGGTVLRLAIPMGGEESS